MKIIPEHPLQHEESILACSMETETKAIILGRRQRSAKEHESIRSTTSAVISAADCPLLIVPLDRCS